MDDRDTTRGSGHTPPPHPQPVGPDQVPGAPADKPAAGAPGPAGPRGRERDPGVAEVDSWHHGQPPT